MKYVIALGGNALDIEGELPTAENQLKAIKRAVDGVIPIIKLGHSVILVHGNGPQVGRIVLQNESTEKYTPAMPFDVCGAMSQGMIGYHLQQALGSALREHGLSHPTVTLVTQVLVDESDIAFKEPTKPIGSFYSEADAKIMMQTSHYTMKEDAGRGYRRVIASPKPQKIIEMESIRTLTDAGHIVIACGGGGIPVIEREENTLVGIDAVIDKDHVAALLAKEWEADGLIIATAVKYVCIHFGKENQQELEIIHLPEIKAYMNASEFAQGSMLPKVQAAIQFLENKAKASAFVAITSLDSIAEAIREESGTRIYS
ncbi:carbamate kinase [Entomospira entomophila]|uniref:Carbamate kinase n=1 Tax=Entomospira entomophila TaxID=2719988 RepID=A0A968GAC8_9SPIO|nr:carbamate kinase [Entomospira entomophilus]NIZ40013.1 carbamate kinase [Entomospira entomophilus]WDI35573.1 carbamate kinase [Entomospira entomophilus]